MSVTRVEIYDLYLAAWSAIPDAERERLLRACLSDNMVFVNPQQIRRGIADVAVHLEGFQQRTPGGSFRMNNMVGWGDQALAEWQLVDAAGEGFRWSHLQHSAVRQCGGAETRLALPRPGRTGRNCMTMPLMKE